MATAVGSGGYQAQKQISDQVINGIGIPGVNVPLNISSGIPQNVDSSVFGGRLYYFPTRRLSILAQVDETLGMATAFQPTVPEGAPTRSITGLLQANYILSYGLSVGARFGYTRANFIGIDKLDNGYMAGASLNYEMWRNLLLTLDYQYWSVHSTGQLSDFNRNVYTAGLTYRY